MMLLLMLALLALVVVATVETARSSSGRHRGARRLTTASTGQHPARHAR
ncbi:hypothetical protein ACIRPK_33470 [Kitasatospora sp. NPDC101801]